MQSTGNSADLLLVKGTVAEIFEFLKQPVPLQHEGGVGAGLVPYKGVVICMQKETPQHSAKDWALGHAALTMVLTAMFWEQVGQLRYGGCPITCKVNTTWTCCCM